MKAIVQDAYGPPEVLRLEEIEKPVVNDGAVLLRVHAASVNPLDWHFMRGTPFLARMAMGRTKPKVWVRGVDVAGRVEAVGEGVKRFLPGDDVFGLCNGAFAEYATALENHLIGKPAGMTYEQAAAVPAAALPALQVSHRSNLPRPPRGQGGDLCTGVAERRAGSYADVLGLMDTRCCGGGPKFPQCEPTRRIRRGGRSDLRRGRRKA